MIALTATGRVAMAATGRTYGVTANDSEWIPPCDLVSDSVDTDNDSVVFPALHDVCEDVTKVQELLKSRLDSNDYTTLDRFNPSMPLHCQSLL
jgi:hypothetical protein